MYGGSSPYVSPRHRKFALEYDLAKWEALEWVPDRFARGSGLELKQEERASGSREWGGRFLLHSIALIKT